ncbi:hypothetical protein GCM10010387_05060 [Streptomyces inusitatus]|uniref:DUF2690 domain-containing protein n=1 Tax=Streptomyces inusitatus TaxID=68221 RepID=A0A918PND0_9ACTN|nr:DUF2690 domain-containing protein [Streptomyces inusitatus]GGZ15636.1 hypothetical protein GCM10010387_05060 [Streptomyces inusitatus]
MTTVRDSSSGIGDSDRGGDEGDREDSGGAADGGGDSGGGGGGRARASRSWIRRHGPESLIGALIVAIVAALVPVILSALLAEESPGASDGGNPADSPSASADVVPGCKGETCDGLDPEKARCTRGTVTLRDEWAGLMRLEIRYNPRCEAVWAKLTGARPGDTVTITTSPTRRQAAKVDWGKTQYTTMLPVHRKDFSAQAVAVAVKGNAEQEIPKGYELRVGADGTHLPSAPPTPGSSSPS